GDRVDRQLSDQVLRLSALVRASNIPGIIETVPTFRSLLVLYDPLTLDHNSLIKKLERLLHRAAVQVRTTRLWRLPACYEPSYAPDLAEVAERTGRSADEIAQLHAETTFHVYMIGFVPGHPYMGDLPEWLAVSRRADPRVRVPAGSIAIARGLSVIYPV